MDINEYMKTLEKNKEMMAQILNNCKSDSAALALLASKMGPLMDNFSDIEAEIRCLTGATYNPQEDLQDSSADTSTDTPHASDTPDQV